MSMYQRYFRVTSGPLLEKAREIETQREQARAEMIAFVNEIGADNALHYRNGGCAGFKFKSSPDKKVWKQPNSFDAYMPRKNTAEGRAMQERIKALPAITPVADAIEVIGLEANCPVLIEGRVGHCSTLTGSAHLGVLFVGVPWRDVSPEQIASYRQENEAGRSFSMEMEHLCWKPSADMVEIKRWELDKEVDELNARLKAMADEGKES